MRAVGRIAILKIGDALNKEILSTMTQMQRSHRAMRGLTRSPIEQALLNAEMAIRALDLAPQGQSDLCPHPLVVVRAELENVRRYLAIELEARASVECLPRNSEHVQPA